MQPPHTHIFSETRPRCQLPLRDTRSPSASGADRPTAPRAEGTRSRLGERHYPRMRLPSRERKRAVPETEGLQPPRPDPAGARLQIPRASGRCTCFVFPEAFSGLRHGWRLMKKPASRSKAAARPRAERPAVVPPRKRPAGDAGSAAPSEPLDASQQARIFESAAALFHSGQYRTARELFQKAARGPSREVAHAAQLRARMCQRRLEGSELAPQTAEDHYNLAVALVNEHRIEAAEQHLRLALAQSPQSDHLYYVMALCRALGGDLDGAYTHMKRAIELQPQNRIAARNDPDFAEIGQQPPLLELLYPERNRSG